MWMNDLIPFLQFCQFTLVVTQHFLECAVCEHRMAIDVEEANPDLAVFEDRTKELLTRLQSLVVCIQRLDKLLRRLLGEDSLAPRDCGFRHGKRRGIAPSAPTAPFSIIEGLNVVKSEAQPSLVPGVRRRKFSAKLIQLGQTSDFHTNGQGALA